MLLALLAMPATGKLLQTTAKCGPNTKLFISDAEDAAGTAQYTQISKMTDGTCIDKGVENNLSHVKFCGPGKLTISRMSCKRHDYKTHAYEHASNEYTTQCEEIALGGTLLDGYFGSAIVSC